MLEKESAAKSLRSPREDAKRRPAAPCEEPRRRLGDDPKCTGEQRERQRDGQEGQGEHGDRYAGERDLVEVEGDDGPSQQRRGEPGDTGPRREARHRVEDAPAAAPLDALGDPRPHDDDARHGEEAELERDLPHHAGVERRQHQRGEHQGGEPVPLASEVERRQVEGGHDRGPLRRRRQSGEHGVAPDGEQRERKDQPAGPPGEPPRQRQRHHQRHADVQTRDGQQVRRAGVAEAPNDVGRNVRTDADGQGLGQGGLRLGEGTRQGPGDLAAHGEQGAV